MSYNKNTAIDWPGLTHSLNPVVGCKRGCEWLGRKCYARELHDKRHKAYLAGKLQSCKQYALPFSEIQYFPERLTKPPKSARRVFVGDLTDIEYWPECAIYDVIKHCMRYSYVEFMFLTKNVLSYSTWDWPKNTMQGLTMICTQTEHCQKEMLESISYYVPRPFLSIEPLLGTLKTKIDPNIELVIVGKLNHRGAALPKKEWVESIERNVPADKLYWKNGKPDCED